MTSPTPRPPLPAPLHRHSLSVTIIARNEADRIRKALESVAGWVDEIIVLDSGSEDETVAICREYTDQVFCTDWPGDGPQNQRALELARGEWVLRLDADERVTPELRAEIEELLDRHELDAAGFRVRWSTYFFGRYCDHGSNGQAHIVLFRREGASYDARRIHHGIRPAPGPIRKLRGRRQHESFRDFDGALTKHAHYSLQWARDHRGRKSSVLLAMSSGAMRFLQDYVLRAGFLDGSRGLLRSGLSAQYAFNKYAALWAATEHALEPGALDARPSGAPDEARDWSRPPDYTESRSN